MCRLSVASTGLLRLSLSSAVRTYATAHNAPVPSKSKVWESADEAVKDIKSGSMILSGGCTLRLAFNLALLTSSYSGFGLCGTPGTVMNTSAQEDIFSHRPSQILLFRPSQDKRGDIFPSHRCIQQYRFW